MLKIILSSYLTVVFNLNDKLYYKLNLSYFSYYYGNLIQLNSLKL